MLTVFYTSRSTHPHTPLSAGRSTPATQPHPPLSAGGIKDLTPCHSISSEEVFPHHSSVYDSTSQCPSLKDPLQDQLTSMDPFPVPGSAVDSPTECTSGPTSAQPPHQRARWGSIEKRSLEDCLASLSEFDAHHQGRVSSFDRQGKVATTEVVLAVSHRAPSLTTLQTSWRISCRHAAAVVKMLD